MTKRMVKMKSMTKWPRPTPLLCKEMLPRMPGSWRVMYSEMAIIRQHTKLETGNGKKRPLGSLIIQGNKKKECPGKEERKRKEKKNQKNAWKGRVLTRLFNRMSMPP